MAKQEKPKNTQPGRFKQLIQVYKLTIKNDKNSLWWSLLGLLGGVLVGVLVGLVVGQGNPLAVGLWGFVGLLAGALAFMIIMSRHAERAAYGQLVGREGAVGAVLSGTLKRGWRGSEMPVHISPKTREAVYRAVGPAGVVLIGEGTSRARVQAMLNDEQRKVARVVPGVTVKMLYVVGDADSVPLAKISTTLVKMKRTLNRNEVSVVAKRLESLGTNIPIPKGIDPNRMRASRR